MYWKKVIPDENDIKKRKKAEEQKTYEWNVEYASWDKKHRDEYNQKHRKDKRRAEYKSRGKHFIKNSALESELEEYEELIKERRKYLNALRRQREYAREIKRQNREKEESQEN